MTHASETSISMSVRPLRRVPSGWWLVVSEAVQPARWYEPWRESLGAELSDSMFCSCGPCPWLDECEILPGGPPKRRYLNCTPKWVKSQAISARNGEGGMENTGQVQAATR